jgi:hypothetical protein
MIKLYSKPTIIVFSLLGSTLYGATLYSMNLYSVGKKKIAFTPLLFALVYNFIMPKVISGLGIDIYGLVNYGITNLGGGLILAFVLWKEQIDQDYEFENRSIWGPLAALLSLIAFFLILIYFLG